MFCEQPAQFQLVGGDELSESWCIFVMIIRCRHDNDGKKSLSIFLPHETSEPD